jgi:hypothetical protein
MYGATARQRPVKESLDNGKRSREHHLTARALTQSFFRSQTNPDLLLLPPLILATLSQLQQWQVGKLATWNRRTDTQDSQFLQKP